MTSKSSGSKSRSGLLTKFSLRSLSVHEMEKFTQNEESSWYRKLRQKEVRRRLVALNVFLLVTIPLMGVGQDGTKEGALNLTFTLSFFTLTLFLYIIYFQMRTSIRLIADAPEEFLDERQIQLRNHSYLESYRILSGVVVIVGLAIIVWAGAGMKFSDHEGLFTTSFISLLMMVAVLPTMVLAWKEEEI